MGAIAAVLVAAAGPSASAVTSSGTAYALDQAVVNSFGGAASSAGTSVLSSGGEAFVGSAAGTTYRFDAGYVAQLQQSLTLTLDSGSVALAPFPGGGSEAAETQVTVQTDAPGYTLYVEQDRDLRHTDAVTTVPAIAATVAAPAAWVEGATTGLGFTLRSGTGLDPKWGTWPNSSYARVPATTTQVHAKGTFDTTADVTTVRYRLAVAGSQKAGSYTNQVTYTATGMA